MNESPNTESRKLEPPEKSKWQLQGGFSRHRLTHRPRARLIGKGRRSQMCEQCLRMYSRRAWAEGLRGRPQPRFSSSAGLCVASGIQRCWGEVCSRHRSPTLLSDAERSRVQFLPAVAESAVGSKAPFLLNKGAAISRPPNLKYQIS